MTWKIEHWTLAGPRPLLLQNLFVASKCPHTSLSSCCLLFVPFIVLQCLDAFFNDSIPSVSFKTIMVPFVGLGLGSSASSRALGFWILKRLSNKISWSWELSNSKTSRALQVLVSCSWLNILIMEVDNLSVKEDLSQGITGYRKLLNEASTNLRKTQAHVQTNCLQQSGIRRLFIKHVCIGIDWYMLMTVLLIILPNYSFIRNPSSFTTTWNHVLLPELVEQTLNT